MAKMDYSNFIENGVEEIVVKEQQLEPISIEDAEEQLAALTKRTDQLREELVRNFNEETINELNKTTDKMVKISARLVDTHNKRVAERHAEYEKESAKRHKKYEKKIAEIEEEYKREIEAIYKQEAKALQKIDKRTKRARRKYQRTWE